MKLLTYQYQGSQTVGVLDQPGEMITPVSALGLRYPCMNSLITHATKEELARLRDAANASLPGAIPYADTEKAAPIPQPRQDVICLGHNYLDHLKESARFKGMDVTEKPPAYATYFSKRVNQALPDGGEIEGHLDLDEQLDYEVELAVIIGKDAKKVSASQVEDYIFGYTIINDVSARTLQTRHKQYYLGKSLDGFTSMGPWIVTSDEFAFPLKLAISSYVNGELRQNSNTEHMLFSIPKIIEELSAGMTLQAGSIIATGTPAGVGMGFSPPRFLREGDVVECVIEGIGRLRNRVGRGV